MISAVPGVPDKLPYETHTDADVAEWFLRRLVDPAIVRPTELFSPAKEFKDRSYANADVLLRESAYPYEYVDIEAKLTEKKQPPRAAFYSRLRGGMLGGRP